MQTEKITTLTSKDLNGSRKIMCLSNGVMYDVTITLKVGDVQSKNKTFIEICLKGGGRLLLSFVLTEKIDIPLLDKMVFRGYDAYAEYCQKHGSEEVSYDSYCELVNNVPIHDVVHYIMDTETHPFLKTYLEKLPETNIPDELRDVYTAAVSQLDEIDDDNWDSAIPLRDIFYRMHSTQVHEPHA